MKTKTNAYLYAVAALLSGPLFGALLIGTVRAFCWVAGTRLEGSGAGLAVAIAPLLALALSGTATTAALCKGAGR